MKATKREIAAKIASLVRKRNAINQEIHYWRSRQKPNTEPNTKPNTKERKQQLRQPRARTRGFRQADNSGSRRVLNDVAEISNDGLLKAKKPGETVVTAFLPDGTRELFAVTVA